MVLKIFQKKSPTTSVEKPPEETHTVERPNVILLSDPLAERVTCNAPASNDKNDLAASERASIASNETELLAQISTRIERAKSFGMAEKTCLEAITFNQPVSQERVLESLRTFGLAIFPSIYDADRLSRIAKEYDDLIENGEALANDISAREDTPANSYALSLLRDKLDRERFPETTALFGSPTIQKIAENYFAGQDFDFNLDLFVQWTDHTDVPASGKLHWDKQLTLKSWLYVTDGTEGHGAMRAGAGTAAWMRYIREDAMFDGIPYKQIKNQVEEKGFPVVSTGGPAGTFFLFVTDTAHGATSVAPGQRRNIMRSRSRPVRVKQWANWAAKL